MAGSAIAQIVRCSAVSPNMRIALLSPLLPLAPSAAGG
jgi:hypothetical protein